ncbi:MAG: hypothetical protein L0Y56_05610, partial [Nitrospira sp.]|nr:hypothetical protein [Nitrospira sp.]
VEAESRIQDSMCANMPLFEIHDPENKPHSLVDFWISGTPDDGYGRHPTIIAGSKSGIYQYGLALTEDGMVPKFVQLCNEEINLAGAPIHAVPLRKEDRWVLSPIVEYSGQENIAKAVTRDRIRIEGTILHGGNRVRIIGIHTSEKSPFFELNNGLDDIYRLVRGSSFDFIEAKLSNILRNGRILPLSRTPPQQTPLDLNLANSRYQTLTHFFGSFWRGEFDSDKGQHRDLLFQHSVGENDLAVFRRYRDYLMSFHHEGYEIPEFAWRKTYEKLWKMSSRWAIDINERTSPLVPD